jgi:hypothetical protein
MTPLTKEQKIEKYKEKQKRAGKINSDLNARRALKAKKQKAAKAQAKIAYEAAEFERRNPVQEVSSLTTD